jgi:hypothetical protein
MATMMDWALQYAKKGLYVLPMVNKRPIIQFADKPPLTADEIRDIWSRYPNANIALRTVDFFVIDIDQHEGGKNGFDSIKNWKNNSLLVDTLTQRTAGGGLQMFYLKRSDTSVQQNIGWLPGVDVKAHINNYVMVPPSTVNNRPYEWVEKLPMVTAGKLLVKEINKRKTGAVTGNILAQYHAAQAGTNRTTQLFETIANGLGDSGGRNNALTELVGGLLYRGVGIDETIKLAEMANDTSVDPLSEREFTTTVESMIKKELRRRGDG